MRFVCLKFAAFQSVPRVAGDIANLLCQETRSLRMAKHIHGRHHANIGMSERTPGSTVIVFSSQKMSRVRSLQPGAFVSEHLKEMPRRVVSPVVAGPASVADACEYHRFNCEQRTAKMLYVFCFCLYSTVVRKDLQSTYSSLFFFLST